MRKQFARKTIFWTLLVVIPFGSLVVGGEVAFRLYRCIKPLTTQNTTQAIVIDEQLGWRAAPNYRFHGTMRDAQGSPYEVDIRTNQEGFRIFGNPESKLPKILFLGDSFTHARQVSNMKTYYGILQESQIAEIFSYGTSGYGTLQAFMILERYVDEIQPDAIIFQYCLNDFVNNSYELELRSSWNNAGKRRPYITRHDELIYAVPKTYLAKMRERISHYSLFMNSLFWRFDKLYAEMYKHTTIELIIQQKNGQTELFQEAVHITDHILKRIKKRVAPQIPIYVFASDDAAPFYETFKALCVQNNITFLEGVPQALRHAEQQGVVTKAADRIHWSEAGHNVVANELLRHLPGMSLKRRSLGTFSLNIPAYHERVGPLLENGERNTP